jgi:hypothetical protein
MKVKGFWHIYLINHWYSIVMGQMRILVSSGLYDRVDEINIGCIGSLEQRKLLEKFLINVYPKLKIAYYSQIPEEYEFPTIELIENDHSDYVGFYFHTKGVTRPYETIINYWREYLNESILNQWRLHYGNVSTVYDASAVNFLKSPDHFSGNFWWFNRRYIDNLPKVKDLDHSYRYHAEQWICMRPGKFFYPEFFDTGKDVFVIKKPTHE